MIQQEGSTFPQAQFTRADTLAKIVFGIRTDVSPWIVLSKGLFIGWLENSHSNFTGI
jgi:hypothetical protein